MSEEINHDYPIFVKTYSNDFRILELNNTIYFTTKKGDSVTIDGKESKDSDLPKIILQEFNRWRSNWIDNGK